MTLPNYNYEKILENIGLSKPLVSLRSFKSALSFAMERKPCTFTSELLAIKLRFEDGLTYKAIGQIIGVSNERVRQRLCKGIRHIEWCLDSPAIEVMPAQESEAEKVARMRAEQIERVTDSTRAINSMMSAGIQTVGDMLDFGRDKLLSMSNFGVNTIRELENDLKRHFDLDSDFKIN